MSDNDKAPIRLSAIIDLYYLEAVSNAPSVGLGEHNYRAFEKLNSDATRSRDDLARSLARSFFDYLWLISFGEARHGKDFVQDGYYYPEIILANRITAYRQARCYDIKQNLPLLSKLFKNCVWESGYGGQNWHKLIVAAEKFYQWNDLMFADHVVDICHNGGMAFDKSETSAVIDLMIDIKLETLSAFLTFKRDADILALSPPIDVARYLSHRTKSLLTRYFTLYNKGVVPQWLVIQVYYSDVIYNPLGDARSQSLIRSEWPTYETIKWGDRVLSGEESIHRNYNDDDDEDSEWLYFHLKDGIKVHPATSIYRHYKVRAEIKKEATPNENRLTSEG